MKARTKKILKARVDAELEDRVEAVVGYMPGASATDEMRIRIQNGVLHALVFEFASEAEAAKEREGRMRRERDAIQAKISGTLNMEST